MKDGRTNDEDREGGQRKRRGYVERATAEGHSGRGSASVLPHLRDQLRLKALLPVPFPMPDELAHGKDEHHQ